MQIRKAEQHMRTSLRGIAERAKKDSRKKFGNLYGLLNETNLKSCFWQMNRKAAPGVDAIDFETYQSELDSNVIQLTNELKEHKYKAKLVRRHYIPKAGGRRPLGIPVVSDKLLQSAAANILTAIYEQDFQEFSHGYRRGKSPRRAALELSRSIHRGRFGWIVDADIKGFFDSMDHEWLMKMLEQRIEDKQFLKLIQKWLKAGILEEDGKVVYPVTGTPQGGVISAVLANIYLHYVLDIWFEKVVKPRCRGEAMMMRYADDFVCCFRYKNDAERFYKVLGKRLAKFKLELSNEKTKIIAFTRFETRNSNVFTFLGFEYRWSMSRTGKPLVKMQTSKKKYKAALNNFLIWIKEARTKLATTAIFIKLKQKLQGHWNYYGVRGNYEMLAKYYAQVLRIVFKWLNRRSQRKSFNWQGFMAKLNYYEIPRPCITGYWD
jgi:RNA-directed DNA polymerase